MGNQDGRSVALKASFHSCFYQRASFLVETIGRLVEQKQLRLDLGLLDRRPQQPSAFAASVPWLPASHSPSASSPMRGIDHATHGIGGFPQGSRGKGRLVTEGRCGPQPLDVELPNARRHLPSLRRRRASPALAANVLPDPLVPISHASLADARTCETGCIKPARLSRVSRQVRDHVWSIDVCKQSWLIKAGAATGPKLLRPWIATRMRDHGTTVFHPGVKTDRGGPTWRGSTLPRRPRPS